MKILLCTALLGIFTAIVYDSAEPEVYAENEYLLYQAKYHYIDCNHRQYPRRTNFSHRHDEDRAI